MSHVHQKEPITEPVPLYDDEKALRRRGVNGINHDDELQHDRFTAGNILRGEVGHALPATAFERKAALVNMELDKLGFGRYQACIWTLCGFGYMLDLMFAQAVGLVAEPIYQEMNVVGNTGLIFTCMSVGLTVGAFFWGMAVDIIGRKWAFQITALLTAVFGMLLAAPRNNYAAICGINCLVGFGLGGNIPIDATITLEFLPQNKRFLLALLSMWQPIGVVFACGIAYATVPKYRCDVNLPACSAVASGEACCTVSSNIGWRACLIILGGVALIVFALRTLLFTFHESPKYLIGRGREAEAIEVLHKIAKFNRAPPPTISMDDFAEIDQEVSMISDPTSTAPLNAREQTKKVAKEGLNRLKHLKGLFATPLSIFTFVILTLTYLGDFWSFNLAGSFLPIILARNNATSGTSVTETYRQYVYIYLPGVLGTIMAMVAVQLPIVGRKWSLVLGAALQGLSMALYTVVKTSKAAVGFNAFEYIMQSFFNAILYATTPELFPAYVRGSACGLLSTLGRLSGIVAPFAAQGFLESASSGILWLAVGGIWLAMLCLVFLPVETRNRQSY